MQLEGNIRKLRTKLGKSVEYSLPIGDDFQELNSLIGQKITLKFDGQINCISCGRLTQKSWGQGFCYPCFMNAPESSPCIIRPELCEAHLGRGRDIEWEEKNHNKEHIVYLAKSSAIKVGVTGDYPETRWMDQGASEALILAKVPYRQMAGALEVYLKDYFTDKTNWRRMLKNEISELDLLEEFERAKEKLSEEFIPYLVQDKNVIKIEYPVLEFPDKIKSISFDKFPEIESTLLGIKGQYLFLENSQVLNIRKHAGYYIQFG